MTAAGAIVRSSAPVGRRRRGRSSTAAQRAWNWYDWANSGFYVTVAGIIFTPFVTELARQDACPGVTGDCDVPVSFLGISILPRALAVYVGTVATLLSVGFVLVVGALVDRSRRPVRVLAACAAIAAFATAALATVGSRGWLLASTLFVVAGVAGGASLVAYDSLLVHVAPVEDRDRVSCRGWAFGYLGGAVILVAVLAILVLAPRFGLSTMAASRVCLFLAGLWWVGFSVIPVRRLRHLRNTPAVTVGQGWSAAAADQVRRTFEDLKRHPQTMLFLAAYLFYNDGIQTVISVSPTFAEHDLRMSSVQLAIGFLAVQIVAACGSLVFAWAAARIGAWRTILWSLGAWCFVLPLALVVPADNLSAFVAASSCVGLLLGGTQALSRSLYSTLIPVGRQGTYFGLYQCMDRSTSWFGPFFFGVVHAGVGNYRSPILAVLVFFVAGGLLLGRVRVAAGVDASGNLGPAAAR